MENTAILNTGKLLHIRQYYITSNLPISHLEYVALISLAINSVTWYKIDATRSSGTHLPEGSCVYQEHPSDG